MKSDDIVPRMKVAVDYDDDDERCRLLTFTATELDFTWTISDLLMLLSISCPHRTLYRLQYKERSRMSRLASLSTPTRRQSPSPSPSPSVADMSGGGFVLETTHHRMLKLLIAELKSLFRTWDDLAGLDALKAGQGIVNEQTTMESVLHLILQLYIYIAWDGWLTGQ